MSTLIKNNNKWLKVAGSGVPPVDVVEEDNMNPVTSNAVAKAIETAAPVDVVEEDNMNPVTSNAVAKAIETAAPVDVVEEDNMNPVTSNAVAKACSQFKFKPDWGNRIKVSGAQVNVGYTAPSDGLFIGYWTLGGTTSIVARIYINGVIPIGMSTNASTNVSANVSACVPVNAGDSIASDTTISGTFNFIPYTTA